MASSAQDIPSTAYKPQQAAAGLDPVTVIRTPQADSTAQAPSPDASRTSTLARLFPADEQRVKQADLPAGLQLGDFIVESRIGAGGMGAVFKAKDQRLDRFVALKILSPSQASDSSSVKRFQNEARAAARLDHDNIARIYAVGEANGLHYIAFEYVEGITVRELIRKRGNVDPAETINFMLQISVALKHTAAAGVVHRDIKPSNIILTPQGRAKLVDWGLARKERIDDQSLDLTVSGTTLGTFDYISPEQARDPRNVDVRSDIYSLGCTSYHMLTGSPPYAEGTVLQKLLDHQGKAAPDPRDRNPNVPRELSRIVRKMMSSSPDDRYWSPQALTHDLLKLASESGLRAVHPDGLTWRSQQEMGGSRLPSGIFWWWLGAFSLACLGAILADRWMLKTDERQFAEWAIPQGEANEADDGAFPPPNDSRITNREPGTELSGNQPFPAGGRDVNPFASAIERDEQSGSGNQVFEPLTKEFFSGSKSAQVPLPWSSAVIFPGWDESNFPEKEPGTVGVNMEQEILRPSGTSASPNAGGAGGAATSGQTAPQKLSVAEESTFRILAGNGEFIQNSVDLEAALSVVPDGGVVEFQGLPGKSTVLKLRQLRLVDKAVSLRAANDSQLILQFDTTHIGSEIRTGDFIQIKGGSLTLSHVHLQVFVTGAVPQPWTLFSLEGVGRVRCRQSTITIDSSRQTAASVVRLNRSVLPPVDSMNLDGMEDEQQRRVQFDDCVIRGATDLLLAEASDPASLEISRSLITIDGTLLRYAGDNNSRMKQEVFDVRLSQMAAVVNEGVLFVDLGMSIPRQAVTFQFRADDSILIGQMGQPLIQLTAGKENRTLQTLLAWDGAHNLYAGWDPFVLIRGLTNMEATPTTLGFDAWSQGSSLIKDLNPRQLKTNRPPGEQVTRFDQWTARKFMAILQAESAEGILSGDLTDYGPEYFDLPVPPPLLEQIPGKP